MAKYYAAKLSVKKLGGRNFTFSRWAELDHDLGDFATIMYFILYIMFASGKPRLSAFPLL